MGSDFRTSDGNINVEKLNKEAAVFLETNIRGVFSITELTEKEAKEVENYFLGNGFEVSPRKIAKAKTGIIDFRIDIRRQA